MSQKNNLALVGYGKMGRLIEQLAPEYDFTVSERLDEYNNIDGAGIGELRGVDVAIEFSTPETAPDNLKKLAEAKIQAVTGTTGWLEHLPAVEHRSVDRFGQWQGRRHRGGRQHLHGGCHVEVRQHLHHHEGG